MAEDENKLGVLRTMALTSRAALASALGMQFGGARDLYKVFGYKTTLQYTDYFAKYLRQDIAKRIVNAPATATWRNPPEIVVDDTFKAEWGMITKQHNIWSQIGRVDKLAGIGNYAVLLLGIDDAGDLSRPVNARRQNNLLYMQPYSQASAEIIELEADPTSARFGMPKMYKISLLNPDTGLSNVTGEGTMKSLENTSIKVHHSRVIHIAEDTLENNYLGTPRLQAVYNLLDDLLKVAGGTSETYWLASNRGMQADVDKDADLSAEDAAALSDELDEYQHQLRRWVKTKGVKINSLGGDTPEPKGTFNVIIALISGATGIPRRILTGSEAGQLASDQDRANWADRIKERRTDFAEPKIIIPLILGLSEAGVISKVDVQSIDTIWPPNFQLTPLEEAQMMAQKGRAAINLTKAVGEVNPIISVEEARSIVGFSPAISGELPVNAPKATPQEDIAQTPSEDAQDSGKSPNDQNKSK